MNSEETKEKNRLANRAKLRSFRLVPKYKYCFQIPRDYNHAIKFDGKMEIQDGRTVPPSK